jgi:hypothetical protein
MGTLDQLDESNPWCPAISKTSAPGGMVRITWHPLQSKVCNAENVRRNWEPNGLNCIGIPQNGQRGCGASVSMHWLIAPEWLMKGKFDLQRRPFQNLEYPVLP